MSLYFEIDVADVLGFIQELEGIDETIAYVIRDTVDATLNVWKQYAVAYTPRNTGYAADSIGTVLGGAYPRIEGKLVMEATYGLPLEEGRVPGKWPPRDAIALWVRRRFGVTGKELDSITFLVQRKIGTQGTEGARMFQRAYDDGSMKVDILWEEVPGIILGKVAGN